ncbi:alginate lyase family protein [Maribellus sp. YY47]|uniref:alginate lyase family protein n=1 Tax=Maribellus sp. YY47 TaxID=2929486 RepID=UPI0020016A9F|nr:alginate lyase family protein [Maribellus sp. YY47]MCK3685166.1 heparinase II/III family protein [Maribellus sp. YY47]
MDYLLQPNMELETGRKLIEQFINDLPQNPTGLEPYPIALRGINWIKFLSRASLRGGGTTTRQSLQNAATTPSTPRHCEDDDGGRNNLIRINGCLYAQYLILLDNLEYHLMANHLLEDGFSLLFAAFYFKDDTFFKKAKGIIEVELKEQILDDGAHFELSPMYHQVILDRLLDGINLLQNNPLFETQDRLLDFMKEKADRMLQWLNTITFNNGQIPLLNDSAPGIAPTTGQLNAYAERLKLLFSSVPAALDASGYRKFISANYECIVDVGAVGPSYQPGHAHADTFNFVLNVNHKPVLIDTGISTYEANAIRLAERGTAAHNTVAVYQRNSSQVWSSFRVAQRANVEIIKEEKNRVTATHDGFRSIGTSHQRSWLFDEQKIRVEDILTGRQTKGTAYFHFSPGLIPIKRNNEILINDTCISFEGAETISLIKAQLPDGYNRSVDYHKLEIVFQHKLVSIIKTKG